MKILPTHLIILMVIHRIPTDSLRIHLAHHHMNTLVTIMDTLLVHLHLMDTLILLITDGIVMSME